MGEKRKAPRARTIAVVSFKVQSARLAGGTRIKDISESGICIPSKLHFEVGSTLELEIRSDDLKVPVKTLARVVWIAPRQGKFPFEVGLDFLQLPEDVHAVLRDYVRGLIDQGQKDVSWLE